MKSLLSHTRSILMNSVKPRVAVLYYHHVGIPPEKVKFRGGFVHPNSFLTQLNWLKFNNYYIANLQEIKKFIKKELKLPRKSVVFTFDDGYHDFYTYAYPMLKKFSYKATVFVSPKFVGSYNEWDSEVVNAKLPLMSWDEIKETQSSGLVNYGAHTLTHPWLSKLSEKDLESEIALSKKMLEKWLDTPVTSFCYPYGDYNKRSYEMVSSRFDVAVTTKRGFVQPNDDPWLIKRIEIKRNTNIISFWIKLNTNYEVKKGNL